MIDDAECDRKLARVRETLESEVNAHNKTAERCARLREALDRIRREAAERDADGHRDAEDFLHWVKAEISNALKETT